MAFRSSLIRQVYFDETSSHLSSTSRWDDREDNDWSRKRSITLAGPSSHLEKQVVAVGSKQRNVSFPFLNTILGSIKTKVRKEWERERENAISSIPQHFTQNSKKYGGKKQKKWIDNGLPHFRLCLSRFPPSNNPRANSIKMAPDVQRSITRHYVELYITQIHAAAILSLYTILAPESFPILDLFFFPPPHSFSVVDPPAKSPTQPRINRPRLPIRFLLAATKNNIIIINII